MEKVIDDWKKILECYEDDFVQNLSPSDLESTLSLVSKKNLTPEKAAVVKQTLDAFEKKVFEITYYGNSILQNLLERKKQCYGTPSVEKQIK